MSKIGTGGWIGIAGATIVVLGGAAYYFKNKSKSVEVDMVIDPITDDTTTAPDADTTSSGYTAEQQAYYDKFFTSVKNAVGKYWHVAIEKDQALPTEAKALKTYEWGEKVWNRAKAKGIDATAQSENEAAWATKQKFGL